MRLLARTAPSVYFRPWLVLAFAVVAGCASLPDAAPEPLTAASEADSVASIRLKEILTTADVLAPSSPGLGYKYLSANETLIYQQAVTLKAGDIVRASTQVEVSDNSDSGDWQRATIWIAATGPGVSKTRISNYSWQRASSLRNHHMPQWAHAKFVAPVDGSYTFTVSGNKDNADDYHAPMKVEESLYGNLVAEHYSSAATGTSFGLVGVTTAPALPSDVSFGEHDASTTMSAIFPFRSLTVSANAGDLLRVHSMATVQYESPGSCAREGVDNQMFQADVALDGSQSWFRYATENAVPELSAVSHYPDWAYAVPTSRSYSVILDSYGDEPCIPLLAVNSGSNLQALRFSATGAPYTLKEVLDAWPSASQSVHFASDAQQAQAAATTVTGKAGDIVRVMSTVHLTFWAGDLGSGTATCDNVVSLRNAGGTEVNRTYRSSRGLTNRSDEAELNNTYAFTLPADGAFTLRSLVDCRNAGPTNTYLIDASGTHLLVDHFTK